METTAPKQITVRKMRAGDIAPIFKLILRGSEEKQFNPIYLQPRYMAGLGIQLFTLLFGRIQLPSGVWYRANGAVLDVDGKFGGFCVFRHGVLVNEIYMVALSPEIRGRKYGEWFLKKVIADAPASGKIIADCLPASKQMQVVLRHLGFRLDKRSFIPQIQRYFYDAG